MAAWWTPPCPSRDGLRTLGVGIVTVYNAERGEELSNGKYRDIIRPVDSRVLAEPKPPNGTNLRDVPPDPDVLDGLRSGAWLDAQEFPPLRWTVPGLVPEGFGLFVGPPKAGKSWLAAGIGLAAASGGVALGFLRVDQRPVLYLALEDGHRRLQERFRNIMRGQPIPEAISVIIRAQTGEVLPMITGYLERQSHPALVILDTLGKVKPPKRPGEESYAADYAIGGRLKDAIDSSPGSSLVVVHHSRKAESADFVDSVSGTQGIAGSADFLMVLSRKRHEDAALLSVTGRDIAEGEYALNSDGGLWRLEGRTLSESSKIAQRRGEQANLGDRARDVVDLVNQRTETRAADLAVIGIDAHQGRTYLSRLADAGYIGKAGRGVYRGGVASVASVASDPEGKEEATHAMEATPLHAHDEGWQGSGVVDFRPSD